MEIKIILFMLSFFLLACGQEKDLTYQSGFNNCTKIFQERGGQGIYPDAKCLEGFQMPDFEVNSNLGESIKSINLLGKPIVINFWFVGCPPCEAEVPGLNYISNKYQKKANFIAIGRNSNKYLESFLNKNEWNFTHIIDPDELIIREKFKLMWGFPTTLIIDKNGIIRKAFSGGRSDSTAVQYIIEEIEPTLIKLLAEKST